MPVPNLPRRLLLIGCLGAAWSSSLGQNVFFDVAPQEGTAAQSRTVTVSPGSTVPYEVAVTVEPGPNETNISGLAGFRLDVLTELGIDQPVLSAFASGITGTFTTDTSLGTPSGSNILGVAARQDPSGVILPGAALNRRQVLASGRLDTPAAEGDFQVTVRGSADLFVTDTTPGTPLLPLPGVVGTSTGFMIQTRVAAPTSQPAIPFRIGPANLCAPRLGAPVALILAGLLGMRVASHRVRRW